MKSLASVMVAIVALEHLWFLIVEMFLWQGPIGLKTFNLTPEFAAETAALAANQGLYNGFLAAGLLWSLMSKSNAFDLKIFFLGCVVVAGLFGAATVSPRIFFVQGIPACFALVLVFMTRPGRDSEAAHSQK
ncbi:MAG: DUF1304 domain-containing protein [Halioglobus sp.]